MRLNDYQVPADEFKISVSSVFEFSDLSGESSSTSTALKGIKPKELAAGFMVRFKDEELLTGFYRIAEALDANGDLVVYNITERTANAVNIRQVTFSGLDTSEIDDLHAWRVSFRLKEKMSVAEKVEQRQGATVATTNEETVSLSGFESIVKYTEKQLA